MSARALRISGMVLLMAGFGLWGYGFAYSSFWYANAGPSMLESVRIWLSEVAGKRLLPGTVEEFIGLVVALCGVLLQIRSYYGKR